MSAIVRTIGAAAFATFMWAWPAAQAGTLTKVPTREGVATSVFWEAAPNSTATATVLIFPGGAGKFGRLEAGRPTGENFLVRSTPHFLARGLNVAIMGLPSDTQDLDYDDRISDKHKADIRAVLAFVKSQSDAPVWLVGTSRGTVSAIAAAIDVQQAVAGVVVTSSIVSYRKAGALPKQDLEAIKVPVLVMHHAKDACWVCQPHEVPAIVKGLKNAPVKKLIWAEHGAEPRGDECGAWHWHGFVGMEREAVDTIADWIAHPMP